MLNKGWNIVKIPMEVISNNEFSIRRIYQSALFVCISSVQSLSRVWLCATPWISAGQVSLSIANSRSLPKLMSIELVMPSSHLILCCPLLLLPPVPPSIRVFSNESTPQQTKIKPHSAYSPVFPNSDWVSTYSLIHCNSYIHSTNSHLSQLVFWEPGTLPVFMEFKSNSPL